MKCIPRILILFAVVLATAECQNWGSYGSRSSRAEARQNNRGSATYFADGLNGKPTETSSSAKLQQSKPSSRSGIGAWGYIAIMLTVIISGLGMYYFIIFYPIVCKKERMYDVMEMTTV